MSGTVDSAFSGPRPVRGDLDVAWIHGSPATGAAPTRRCSCTPTASTLLLDSGAVDDPTLRRAVDGLIGTWLAARPREPYPLVVAHTHAHGGHRAGDGQFADRPDTVVVGTDLASVREFFGFAGWPAEVVTFELGDRTPLL